MNRKAYFKSYHQRPEVIERRRAYQKRPEVKAHKKNYNKDYKKRPEVIENTKAYYKKYYEKNKDKVLKKNKRYYDNNKEKIKKRRKTSEVYSRVLATNRRSYWKKMRVKKEQRIIRFKELYDSIRID